MELVGSVEAGDPVQPGCWLQGFLSVLSLLLLLLRILKTPCCLYKMRLPIPCYPLLVRPFTPCGLQRALALCYFPSFLLPNSFPAMIT